MQIYMALVLLLNQDELKFSLTKTNVLILYTNIHSNLLVTA